VRPTNVLVYGSVTVASRIKPILEEKGFEMIAFSGELSGRNLDSLLENLDGINFAILDSLEESADSLCHFFGQVGGVSMVLLVDEKTADWDKFCECKTSAFIPHSAGEMEFAARLKNVIKSIPIKAEVK
jgi:hypothetical protein